MPVTGKPYAFRFDGGEHNSYRFTTDDDVKYEIKFVPSTGYFEAYAELDLEVFEMVISVVDNPLGGKLPADNRTAPTIFTIFDHFFSPNRHVLVFICESADHRELARFRKFGAWFYNRKIRLEVEDLAKFDLRIADGERTILLSLIISRRHPQRKLVADMFMDLGDK